MEKFDPDKTIRAIWVIDSESGEQTLRDLKTGEILARKDELGRIING